MTVRLLTGFGRRPQHLLGAWGFSFGARGVCGFFLLVVNLLLRQIDADRRRRNRNATDGVDLVCGLSCFWRAQCVLTGLLGRD